MEEQRPRKRLHSMPAQKDGHPRAHEEPKVTGPAESQPGPHAKPIAWVKPFLHRPPTPSQPVSTEQRARRGRGSRRRSRGHQSGGSLTQQPQQTTPDLRAETVYEAAEPREETETSLTPSVLPTEAATAPEDEQNWGTFEVHPSSSDYWFQVESPASAVHPSPGLESMHSRALHVVQTSSSTYEYEVSDFYSLTLWGDPLYPPGLWLNMAFT